MARLTHAKIPSATSSDTRPTVSSKRMMRGTGPMLTGVWVMVLLFTRSLFADVKRDDSSND